LFSDEFHGARTADIHKLAVRDLIHNFNGDVEFFVMRKQCVMAAHRLAHVAAAIVTESFLHWYSFVKDLVRRWLTEQQLPVYV
jgi:hypothetical protein